MSGPPDSGPDQEQMRRRRTTRHLLLSLAAIIVFGSAFGVLFYRSQVALPPTPTASPSAPPSPTVDLSQPTILVQASGDNGTTANMLTGVGVGNDPTATLISIAGLLVLNGQSAGAGSYVPIAEVDTRQVSGALAATIGVRVDGSWNLDRKAFAGLIDSVGGVTISVDTRTRVRDGQGNVVLVLKRGKNKLTGTDASWYAVGTIKGETAEEQQDRSAEVFTEVLGDLPTDPTMVRETLTSLGALAPSTIPIQALAEYLVELTMAMKQGTTTAFDLPTTVIPIGTGEYAWTNFAEATPKLREALPLAQWNTRSSPPRVLVMDGTGRPGWIASTRKAIQDLGYVYVDGRGTPAQDLAKSEVQVRRAQAWGKRVADGLELPASAVMSVPLGQTAPPGEPWANVDVVLGLDYKPS